MSLARINYLDFENEEDLEVRMKFYKENDFRFHDAECLMSIRTSPTSVLEIVVYPDKETADTNLANREKFMHKVKDNWFMEGSVDRLQLNKRIY